MPIGKENVVVVYRQNDDDSLDFANQYKAIRELNDDQLIALPCSNQEILGSYSIFQAEVETPLLNALGSSPVSNYNVQAILVAPFVPGGFTHDNDTVSTTSRLSRIHHLFSKAMYNPLFDRQVFKRFDSDDDDIALICTRFDSPTVAITNTWLNNLRQVIRQVFATGVFYFDAFASFGDSKAVQYTDELSLFADAFLPLLGVPFTLTIQIDPYVDSLIPSVADDSFFWGWGADRGSLTFFGDSTHARGFFYNADFDGAYTMRDIDERTWPVLAIRQGYVATAGPLSDPGIDGFLRPRPFFDALFRGATLGEAFMFSQPYLDWTMACFGDPLMTLSFPEAEPITDLTTEDEAWQLMMTRCSQSIIRLYRKTLKIKEQRDEIVLGDDPETSLDLVYPMEDLYRAFGEDSWKNDYVNLVNLMISFALFRNRYRFAAAHPAFDDYLSLSGNKVTELFLEATLNSQLTESTSPDSIEKEGSWVFETTIERDDASFAFFHFELDVASDENFYHAVVSKQSFSSLDGWYFQDFDGEYRPLPKNGVTSAYAGRNIRYVSQDGEELSRSEYYHFRVRQRDQDSFGAYRYSTQIIFA